MEGKRGINIPWMFWSEGKKTCLSPWFTACQVSGEPPPQAAQITSSPGASGGQHYFGVVEEQVTMTSGLSKCLGCHNTLVIQKLLMMTK